MTGPERNETDVVYGNTVRIFNASGMEAVSFGDGLDLGQLRDAALDAKGGIILQSYKDNRSLVTRCTARRAEAVTSLRPKAVFP